MSQSCKIAKCSRIASSLCTCCQKQICKIHFDEHYEVLISQLQPITNELTTLNDNLKSFDINKTTAESREKLEQWRLECHQEIDRLFQRKCQELDQCIIQKISKQTEKIEQIQTRFIQMKQNAEITRQEIQFLTTLITQIKKEIINIDNTFVQIRILPLKINENILPIYETIRPKIDLSTLPSSCKTISHSAKSCSVLASNDQLLLAHQERRLCLINQQFDITKNVPWPYNNILDMCWSTATEKFILINENDIFLVDEKLIHIEKLPAFSHKQLLSCTCSDKALYISTNELGSSINEFHLLPSIEFSKQWSCPITCTTTEIIDNMIYNNETLALLIKNSNEKTLRIELRFCTTLDYVWSLPLDIQCTKTMVFRCCLLSFDEWLIADYETSRLLHITKFGQIKNIMKYKSIPYHVNLFNQNILVVFCKNGKNFHQLV